MNAMIDSYRRASLSAQDPAMAHVNWGIELAETGQFEEAVSKFEKATQLDPLRSDPWLNWGVALAKQGDLSGAIAKWTVASELEPERGSIYMLWGAALVELGQLDAATEQYQKAIAIAPKHPEPWINWGIALARAGCYRPAMERFQKALALKPSQPQVLFLWGAVLAEQGEYEAANTKFEEVLKTHPRHEEALYFWAVSLNRLGRYPEAVHTIRRALNLNPDRADYYLCLGDALANQGRLDVALANYRHALQLGDDQRVEGWLSVGQALNRLGKADEALDAFRQAEQRLPGCPGAAHGMGMAWLTLDDNEAARQAFEQELARNPQAVDTYLMLARLLMQEGDWLEAGLYLQQAAAYAPQDPECLRLQGLYAAAHGQWGAALEALQQSQEHNREPAKHRPLQSCRTLLDVLNGQLNLTDALRQLRPLYRDNPRDGVTLVYAVLQGLNGQPDEALEKLAVLPEEALSLGELRLKNAVQLWLCVQTNQRDAAHVVWQTLATAPAAPTRLQKLEGFGWYAGALHYAQRLAEVAPGAEYATLNEKTRLLAERAVYYWPGLAEAWTLWLQVLGQTEAAASSASPWPEDWTQTVVEALQSPHAPVPLIQSAFAQACFQQNVPPQQVRELWRRAQLDMPSEVAPYPTHGWLQVFLGWDR